MRTTSTSISSPDIGELRTMCAAQVISDSDPQDSWPTAAMGDPGDPA